MCEHEGQLTFVASLALLIASRSPSSTFAYASSAVVCSA
jgi:hypothetical protein